MIALFKGDDYSVGSKGCNVCGILKPLEEFHRVGGGSDERRRHCRTCVAKTNRKWRDANRERINAQNKAWQRANRERFREMVYAWRRENPDQSRAIQRASEMRRRASDDSFDADSREFAEIVRRDPCCYCCAPAKAADHIIPLRLRGRNHWDNLTGACISCNSSKNAKPLLDFLLSRVA